MRLVNKLVLGCGVMALGFLGNPAMANDYELFSLDLGDDWVEMMPEQGDETDNYILNLFNKQDNAMLVITTKKLDIKMDEEMLKTAAKTTVELLKQRGMTVSKQGYDEGDEYYYAEGLLQKNPYKMRVLIKEDVMLNVLSIGKNTDAGLDMIDEIEIK